MEEHKKKIHARIHISKSLQTLSVRSIKLFQLKQIVHFHNLYFQSESVFKTLSVPQNSCNDLSLSLPTPAPHGQHAFLARTRGISYSSTSNWGRTPTSLWMTLRVRPKMQRCTLRLRLLHELGLTTYGDESQHAGIKCSKIYHTQYKHIFC